MKAPPPSVTASRQGQRSIVAFIYENGKLEMMDTLPGVNRTEPRAVNEAGQVVGFADNVLTGDPPSTAFLWQDGVMTALKLPLGPKAFATDINDAGRVVCSTDQQRRSSHHHWQARP